MDWLDLLAVQGTLKSLLQHYSSKASTLRHSAFFRVQLTHPYMTTGKTVALTRRTFVGKVMSLLPSPMSWSFCFVLSSKFYSFSSYVQGIDPFWVCFLHMRKWKWKSLSHFGLFGILRARILEWVAFPFSSGIFLKQGLNPGLPHCGHILYQLSHQGSPFCTWCKVKRSPAFLCMWISHFPSTVHWRNCSFSIEWS